MSGLAEFLDPCFGLGAEGAGLGVFGDFAVVEEGGRVLAFFAIEFGNFKGALDVAGGELGDLAAGVGGAFGVGVAQDEVVEGFFGSVEVGGVLVSLSGLGEEDVADLELRFGGV